MFQYALTMTTKLIQKIFYFQINQGNFKYIFHTEKNVYGFLLCNEAESFSLSSFWIQDLQSAAVAELKVWTNKIHFCRNTSKAWEQTKINKSKCSTTLCFQNCPESTLHFSWSGNSITANNSLWFCVFKTLMCQHVSADSTWSWLKNNKRICIQSCWEAVKW